VLVEDGAKFVLETNAIVENHSAGLFAVGGGTNLTAVSNLIEGTLPAVNDELIGLGAGVESGVQATFESNAIVANHLAGLWVRSSFVIAKGNIIEGTLPQEGDGEFGIGVVCGDGATLDLASSVVHNNRVSAVQVAGAAAAISRSLIDVVSSGTFTLQNRGTFDNVGDGLLATDSTLDITDTRVQGCVRAGVLYDNSTGTLSGVVSTNNKFGLVLQGDPRPSYETGNNQFTGNTTQDILIGGDLPVPDAPAPVPP
jgi:hypothetical protein